MKAIKILYNKHTCFIFSRNVYTFNFTDNFNIPKSKKSSREMAALHRTRREDRFMYGPITKKKRQSLEQLPNTSQSNKMPMDSELWWQLKYSKFMAKACITAKNITIIKVNKMKVSKKINEFEHVPKHSIKKVRTSAKKSIIIKSVMPKDVKEVETTSDKQNAETKHNNTLETADITDKLKISSLENTKLLDVVINNMTTFPILNTKKKLPKVAGKMDILSISAKDEPTALHYPSVTKILAATMSLESQKALELWKTKLIAEMGEDKFNEYYQEQLKNGRLFHSCIENTLCGKNINIPDHVQPAFDSLNNIVKELEDVKAIESHVSHEHLRYKGKIDCIAVYRGELCVIDWKKSEKNKSSLALTYDAPIQLAAYIGALNYSKSYPFTVNRGLIVVGYTNGKPADTYVVKDNVLKTYWKKWLMKLQKYWSSVAKKD